MPKKAHTCHVRYGYRRLTLWLRREGWKVNAKRIYRLYPEEQLIVRTKQRRKMARRQRGTMATAVAPNENLYRDWHVGRGHFQIDPLDRP